MINTLDLEFFQAFNPLYAVPIVAVIICAFLVYALGFKTPVQPPSFDGIEEEKKITKKRKTKENTKAKTVQNGKLNVNSAVKTQTPPSKKKEPAEKTLPSDKPVAEKPSVAEKKAAKKAKAQNEKKNMAEKKRDVQPNDEMNDDGWVQLVSKKGRKNRKKEETSVNEIQSIKSVKSVEVSKSDVSSHVEDSPKKVPEIIDKDPTDQKQVNVQTSEDSTDQKQANIHASKDSTDQNQVNIQVTSKDPTDQKQVDMRTSKDSTDKKQVSSKAKKDESKKKKDLAPKVDKAQEQVLVAELEKPDVNDLKKLPTKENSVKEEKPREESNSKSKKKKKKNLELVQEQNDANEKMSEPPAVQIISEIPTSEIKMSTNTVIPSDSLQVISGNSEADLSSEVKASNVAFDELAGLYPEVKEQKKKKKVRRDH